MGPIPQATVSMRYSPPLPPPLKSRGLFALAALLTSTPTLAQEAQYPDIVVTGRGIEPEPGDRSAQSATSILAIDRTAGTASGRLEDALRDIPTLAEFRRSDSTSAHPTSQGITLRGLGGNASSRALVLLDGVPQADPFGGWVPFPAYMPERLRNVVLTRGGGSGYFGPGALGGTIEMNSAGPRSDPLRLALAGGSRHGFNASAAGSAALGEGWVLLAGQVMRGDGFVPVVAEDRGPVDRAAPYRQGSLALRAVVPVGTDTELQTNLLAFRDRRDRGVDFTAIKSDGADASVRLVGRGPWGWEALAYLQTRAFASRFASVNDARTTVTPTLDQYSVPSTGVGGRIELAPPLGKAVTLHLGADARRVSGRTRELFTYVAGSPTRRRAAGGESRTTGGFADLKIETGPLTIGLSARLDHWRITGGHLLERALASGVAVTDLAFADRDGWEATGRAGGAIHLGGTVTLRLQGYRGWRLPTLNELYRPFRVGADATAANAALDPERLWGVDGGVDIAPLAGLTLHATAYWNRLDGAIANVTLANGPGTFPGVGFVSAAGVYRQRQNLDAVESKGIELEARLAHGPVTGAFSYTYTDARVRGSGVAAPLDGLRPAQVARHGASAMLGWQRGGWAGSVTARYIGPQYEDDQNQRLLADAVTVDLVARAPIASGLSIEARAENLFDARVEAGISGPGVIERALPRTLWIGFRYSPRR